MAHPPLECFDRDVSLVAHGGKGDAEIVAADLDILPGRKLFPFPDQLLVRLCLSVPALVASVDLVFQKADVGLIFPVKRGQGHHEAVLFLQEKSVPALQRFRQAVIQRNNPLGGVSLTLSFNRLISVREGGGAAYGDRLFLEVNIPVDVQIKRFSSPKSGKHHGYGAWAEVMWIKSLPAFRYRWISMRHIFENNIIWDLVLRT